VPEIRDARENWQSQNHLYKILHRGYTSTEAADMGSGEEECPFEFYQDWVNDPEKAQKQIESVTRKTTGTEEAPIEGLTTAADDD